MLSFLISITIGISYALWRRCYGGLDSDIWKRWFPKYGSALHRNFWRIINLIFISCLMYFYKETSICWALYTAFIMQFIFWDWTFGMYMHIGRRLKTEYPDEDEKKEYGKQAFGPFLNWLFEDIDEIPARQWSISVRYGDLYDFLGMLLRFSTPSIFLFFVPTLNIGMCFLGTLIALSYLLDMVFKDKGIKNFLTDNFNELAAGFFTGFFISIL